MNPKNKNRRSNKRFTVRHAYLVTVFFLTLTGFGQMPIFKRYYIADIPGFGWLGKFYVTHYMHYLFALLLLIITSYIIADYLLRERKRLKISISGYLRGTLIAGLVATGIFLVINNLSGTRLSPGFIIFLDLSHFGLVMVLLMVSLYSFVFNKRWSKEILTKD